MIPAKNLNFSEEEKNHLQGKLFCRSLPSHETGCLEWTGAKDRGGYGRSNLSLAAIRVKYKRTGKVHEYCIVMKK